MRPVHNVVAILLLTLALTAGIAHPDSGFAEPPKPAPEHYPGFDAGPELTPAFQWKQTDYAVRCKNRPVEVNVRVPKGWRAKLTGRPLLSKGFRSWQPLGYNHSFRVTFVGKAGRKRVFHVRCLPADFPAFRVLVNGKGAPRLTLVLLANHYAVAFDAGGAPVWWLKLAADPGNPFMTSGGKVGLTIVKDLRFQRFEVRDLAGRILRRFLPKGEVDSDTHDFQQLPNGNFVFGAHREVPFDASPFGGASNAILDTAQIQEVRPSGKLVWKWNSFPRIHPSESGRWWSQIPDWGLPYDQTHWNSIDRMGRYILLSFRHLDAVYKVDRRTGRIVWKLGGTRTSKSLKVRNDPYGSYPFGGQHDARFMPDSSITVFDNQTGFGGHRPRAVRYRIDEKRRTATLIRQIVDHRFAYSSAFGSARLGRSGNWLICWGWTDRGGTVAAYGHDGKAFYRIFTPGVTPYRANPVFGSRPTLGQVRRGMDRMARRLGGPDRN